MTSSGPKLVVNPIAKGAMDVLGRKRGYNSKPYGLSPAGSRRKVSFLKKDSTYSNTLTTGLQQLRFKPADFDQVNLGAKSVGASVDMPILMSNRVFQINSTASDGFVGSLKRSTSVWSKSKKMWFLVDSGATVHCCSDKEKFVNMASTSISCAAADGSQHKAKGIGDVILTVQTSSGSKELRLEGVLYVPDFNVTVVSSKKLRSQGYDIGLPSTSVGFMTDALGCRINFQKGNDGLEYLVEGEQHSSGPSEKLFSVGRTLGSEFLIESNFDRLGATAEQIFALSSRSEASDFKWWLQNAKMDELEDRLLNPESGDQQPSRSEGLRSEKIRSRLCDLGRYHPKYDEIATDKYLQMHHRLGHANAEVVTATLRASLSPKDWSKLPKMMKRFCQACSRTKATLHKHDQPGHPTVRGPPDTMTEDIAPLAPWIKFSCDTYSFKEKSIVGTAAHCLIAVCHYSNDIKIIGMAALHMVHDAMEELLAWTRNGFSAAWKGRKETVETKELLEKSHFTGFQTTPAALKSDSAKYFQSVQIKDVYKRYGITHSASSPRSLWRNGRCERAIRSITESANAMRAARRLSPSFQYLAFQHVSSVHRQLATSANPNRKSPHTMIHGTPSTLGHIMPFGAECTVTRHARGQDEDRGIMGIHVGYNAMNRSFKVLVPPTQGHAPYELAECLRQEPGALPKTVRSRTMDSLHVSFNMELPKDILSGKVKLEWEDYFPFSEYDYNRPIEHIPAPRGDESVIDVDYWTQNQAISVVLSTDDDFSDDFDSFRQIGRGDDGPRPHRVSAISEVINGWTKASKTKEADLYEIALKKEQQQLLDMGVVKKITKDQIPAEAKVFDSMMLFTLKRNEAHVIQKGKSRWVFRGDQQKDLNQDPGISFTPSFDSIRLLMAEAAKRKRPLFTGDLPGAYLYGKPDVPLYMRSPNGLREQDEEGNDIYYRVDGNMYGKINSCSVYLEFLVAWMMDRGWVQNPRDPACFHRDGAKVCIYIDDIIGFCDSDEEEVVLKKEFEDFFGDCKFQLPSMYLGCNVYQDTKTMSVHISNQTLIEKLAKRFIPDFDLTSKHVIRTPFPNNRADKGVYVNKRDCPNLEAGESKIDKPYREILGAINYCVTCSRPDLQVYLMQLAKVAENPGLRHFELALHLLKYVVTSRDYGITYHSSGKDMEFYVDSSWADGAPDYKFADKDIYHDTTGRIIIKRGEEFMDADDPEARRSTWCYIGMFASGAVCWKAKASKYRRALSSTEAELQGACEASKKLVNLKETAELWDINVGKTVPVHEDNEGCIHLCLSSGLSSRSKHFELRLLYVKQLEREGILHMTKVHTSDQLADIGTKILDVGTLQKLQNGLMTKGLHARILDESGKRTDPTWATSKSK